MSKLDQIGSEIGRLFDEANAWTFGPAPEGKVAAAEGELGLSFPASYRAFLLHFGAAKFLDLEIFGIPDTRDIDENQPPTFLNVIDQTAGLRSGPLVKVPLPPDLVYIASDGGGPMFFVAAGKGRPAGDSSVYIFGSNIPFQQLSPNFLEFVRRVGTHRDPYAGVRRGPTSQSNPYAEIV